MWGNRDRPEEVTCIACDRTASRTDAREYDKHGDRFDRRDKEFEFICKACYRDLCHQPRGDLEAVLTESGAGSVSQSEFVARYTELATEGNARSEER